MGHPNISSLNDSHRMSSGVAHSLLWDLSKGAIIQYSTYSEPAELVNDRWVYAGA